MSPSSQLSSVVKALDEPALVIDGNHVLVANSAAQELFGRRLEGLDVRLIIRHPRAVDQILSRREGELEITGIGGAERPWAMSVRRIGGLLSLVRLADVSKTRAAEKMRVDFVANASHELRTPLTTILGYAETIADGADLDPADHARFGGIIRGEAKRMLRIIEDLMSLSRIEADRYVAPSEQVDVPELVALAAGNAQALAESRRATLNTHIDEAIPPIQGDRAQLLQALDNLVANALRYGCGQPGCGVTVRAVQAGDAIVLTVSDSGEGIAREHLARLTERFYRVDAARSRDAGGTGLGLAIVKHIVERHRGSMEIRSSVGRGTEVELRLPLSERAPVTKA